MKSFRRSLRFSKKDKEKECEEVPSETPEEERKEVLLNEREELPEYYTLPEVLPTPLSGTF